MRFQRRLYGICSVRFLAFRVHCRTKLVYFCAQSFSKLSKYLILCRNQLSSFKSSYFQSFGSSLQSHAMLVTLFVNCERSAFKVFSFWVTLYIICINKLNSFLVLTLLVYFQQLKRVELIHVFRIQSSVTRENKVQERIIRVV